MRLKCVVVVEFDDVNFKEWALSKIKSQFVNMSNSLATFNIVPEGEIQTATTNNLRFWYDDESDLIESVMGARGSQYFTGHWLDFLHARREEIIPRQIRSYSLRVK